MSDLSEDTMQRLYAIHVAEQEDEARRRGVIPPLPTHPGVLYRAINLHTPDLKAKPFEAAIDYCLDELHSHRAIDRYRIECDGETLREAVQNRWFLVANTGWRIPARYQHRVCVAQLTFMATYELLRVLGIPETLWHPTTPHIEWTLSPKDAGWGVEIRPYDPRERSRR